MMLPFKEKIDKPPKTDINILEAHSQKKGTDND
jgi:hypothetical protein